MKTNSIPFDILNCVKTCTICGRKKELSAFYFDKRASDGRRSECKDCALERQKNSPRFKEYQSEYHAQNKGRIRSRQKLYYQSHKTELYAKAREYVEKNFASIKAYKHQWYLNNIEKCKAQARASAKRNRVRVNAWHSQWKKNNRDKANLQMRRRYAVRYKNDLNLRLKGSLRSGLRFALKHNAKRGSAVADLGCTLLELKAYIESQFTEGMTWENWGYRGWHLDHQTPLAVFDLTNRDQFLAACNYTNLQPLWGADNLKKNAKT